MRNKRIFIVAFIAFILSTGFAIADGQFKNITVYFSKINMNVNGQSMELSRESIFYNGTIYMPLRDLSETLGAEVTWNDTNRAVNLDFLLDNKGQTVFSSAKKGLYQYIAMENNDIMNQMIKQFKKEDMNGMKTVLARYDKLRLMARDLQDDDLELIFEKMMASGELMRSGYQSKKLDDYYLAWTIFNTNAGNLLSLLRDRISASIEP
jgi:hypothetical protein